MIFFAILAPIFAIACLWFSLRAQRRRRLIGNLPTSKCQGVFIGLVEVKGIAEAPQPLRSYLAGCDCIYYEYSIQERWSRTKTETYRDSKGRTQTRTKQETGWTTVAMERRAEPFFLVDDTGNLLVRPDGAELDGDEVFSQTATRSDPLYYGKGPAGSVANSDHVRRFTETAIRDKSTVYVIGQARERQDVVAPEIAADPQAKMFLISTKKEEDISSGYAMTFWLAGIGGFVFAAGSPLAISYAADETFSLVPILAPVFGLGYAAAWAAGWLVIAYNALVDLRQRVQQGWAQIDIQLKRRHDLIPNLVSVVEAYASHERETQEILAEARAQANATGPGESGTDPAATAGRFLAIAEAYPHLKADTAFLQLQHHLSDTEQRIALARTYYNDIVTFYNTRLETVPDGWVGALGGFKQRALMEANGFEREPVQVSLNP